MISGRRGSLGLIWSVDVGADGLVENIETVELVYRSADFGESIAKSVGAGLGLVSVEEGLEDALEEGVPGVVGADDADGGDGYRSGGVDVDELALPLPRLLGLALDSFSDGIFAFGEDFGIQGLAKLRKDLGILDGNMG